MRSGPPVEGRIVGSDGSRIFVATDADERVELDRVDIDSIDHPGNAAMLIGLPGTLVGTLSGVVALFTLPAAIEQGWPEGDSDTVGAAPVAVYFGVVAAVALGVGLPPFIWGSNQWFTSTGNALPPESPALRVMIGPGGVLVQF